MNLQLSPAVERMIDDLIAAGEVRDAEEAILESLRRWTREVELKAAIEEGIRDLDAGRVIDGDEAMRRIRERIANAENVRSDR